MRWLRLFVGVCDLFTLAVASLVVAALGWAAFDTVLGALRW